MVVGSYWFKRQSGGIGMYARVFVATEPAVAASSVEVSEHEFEWLEEAYGPAGWEGRHAEDFRRGALWGAEYALNHRPVRSEPHFVRATILTIRATTVDTTENTVAFATCFAIWDALGVEGREIPFIEGRRIIFPGISREPAS